MWLNKTLRNPSPAPSPALTVPEHFQQTLHSLAHNSVDTHTQPPATSPTANNNSNNNSNNASEPTLSSSTPVVVTLDVGALLSSLAPCANSTNSATGLHMDEVMEMVKLCGASPNVSLIALLKVH